MQNVNPMQLMAQFNQFRNNFKGDPKAEVQKLVSSGQLDQQKLNQLQNMAAQFQNMMRSMNM